MQLTRLMELRQITDADLARSLGCQRSTVHHWKLGTHFPRADMLIKICRILECSADELLGMERSPGKSKARANDLYKAVTQRGQYDAGTIHQMASRFRKSRDGKITAMEKWLRDIAEALYKYELVTPTRTMIAILEEFEQMSMF